MVPAPRQNRPQSQPLTTTLANILRDYHAGGTVLRELLQNADDAGASQVDFHLCTKPPPPSDTPLLHPALHQYEGPSLIAYNSNPPFDATDFDSLQHLGDSLKRDDATKTGKFGLGFNSVYHWTDVPQILSDNNLLLLDPHHSWSAEIGHPPGGPCWDVVKDRDDEAMQNQLRVFQEVLHVDLKSGLDGTAVRIPLRTEEQAKKSKICQKSVSVDEMKKVLTDFAAGFAGGYGVFLKKVEGITVNVDGECVGQWIVINQNEVRTARKSIETAFGEVFITRVKDDFCLPFRMEVEVSQRDVEQIKKITWAVQHVMQRTVNGGDEQLTEWGRERKLFGWGAAATPIDGLLLEEFCGELYTVLPLNKVLNNQPVHIHGLFSISSDRASLHSAADKTMQDHNPFLWNKALFDGLIPKAWAGLLEHICSSAESVPEIEMNFWPRKDGALLDQLGQDICMRVYTEAMNNGYAVFPTATRFVEFEEGLFTLAEEVSAELRAAFTDLHLPVVYFEFPQEWIHKQIALDKAEALLNPSAISYLLQEDESLRRLDEASTTTKKVVLEYLLSRVANNENDDPDDFEILYDIPLFPLEDGTYETLRGDHPGIFVSRYDGEENVFYREPERNLNHSLLTVAALVSLRRVAARDDLPVRYRSQDEFIEYAEQYMFPNVLDDPDVIPASAELLNFVDLAWPWIVESESRSKFGDELCSLWLIPLHGGYLSRFKSCNPLILRSLDGETGKLLLQLSILDSGRPGWIPPLLDTGDLSKNTTAILNRTWSIGLGSCELLGDLLRWLVASKGCLRAASSDLKHSILANIAGKSETSAVNILQLAVKLLPKLPLFKQIWSKFVDGKTEFHYNWISKLPDTSYIGVGASDLPFIPSPGVDRVFICSDDEPVRRMFTRLGLASWPSKAALLENYVLPALAMPGGCEPIPDNVKIEILKLVLCDYYEFSQAKQDLISNLAIVPVEKHLATPATSQDNAQQAQQTLNGVGLQSALFLPILSLIDPASVDLHELWFPDELLFPRRDLYKEFSGVMLQCGLQAKLTQQLAFERIQEFAKDSRSVGDVAPRARKLLQSAVVGSWPESDIQQIKKLNWIPVRRGYFGDDPSEMIKVHSRTCRSSRHRLLVSYSEYLLAYEADKIWEQLFEWNTTITKDILIRQLSEGASEDKLDVVHAVLRYYEKRPGFAKECLSTLKETKCVIGTSGKMFRPDNVFSTGARALSPFLDNVDRSFREKYTALVPLLELKQKPSLKDLFMVQEQLMNAKQPLNERNIAVATETVRLASSYDRSLLDSLLVPDQNCVLQRISEVTFWDMTFSAGPRSTILAHKAISEQVAAKLGIQMFSESQLMGEMGVEDQDDEEEFFQHERTTTRIADTLTRYPANTTFNEYLANAEDTDKATCVDWLLDECQDGDYATERLLTKALAPFQGQALFVHNDGVFLEDDFLGFRNVGVGSKRDEEFAIGQFGRGAQTMYHWTDVPMLITGEFFLILDPQQKFLPLNRKHGCPKPGLKIKLAKIRESCPDQLAPFHGLWGYSTDLDNYEGTIFRFPLRRRGSKSLLTESTQYLDFSATKDQLEKHFETARLSLLFLQHVERVTFTLRHSKKHTWQVWKPDNDDGDDDDELSTFQRLKISTEHVDKKRDIVKETEKWLVARADIQQIPKKLQTWFGNVKKKRKNACCGIAALLSKSHKAGPNRIFSTLPLPFPSNLPVHINATFILSGDRQDISVEDSSSSRGSMWNKWLLQEPLPSLYLDLLEELVREPKVDVFKFWPIREPSKDGLSDLVRAVFWEKITSSENRLYPRAKGTTTAIVKTGRWGGKREVRGKIETFDFSHAKFDMISAIYTSQTQDLLRSWFPNLVRIPETIIRLDFAKVDGADLLSGEDILDKIRNCDQAISDVLEKLAVQNPDSFDELLKLILLVTNMEKLNGCRILPLKNGSLGTLRLLKSEPASITYFTKTETEQDLFAFASELFAADRTSASKTVQKFLKALLQSPTPFNIRPLNAKDIGQLLQKRAAAVWSSAPTLEPWLKSFWSYFAEKANALEGLPDTKDKSQFILAMCGVDKFPIYQATRYGKTEFIRPADVGRLHAIVKPSIESHLDLCGLFPGLVLIHPEMMLPTDRHHSLNNFDTFLAFLDALKNFADGEALTLGGFVSPVLNKDCRATLRHITLHATTKMASLQGASKQTVLNNMRMLPIFPTLIGHHGAPWITAQNALATDQPNLLVPWLKERHRFLSPIIFSGYADQLRDLGVTAIPFREMLFNYVFPNLPAKLQPEHSKAYTSLIEAISGHEGFRYDFSHIPLAASNDMTMHCPGDLLDHRDDVYTAAFPQATSPKFLHRPVRKYRTFWLRHGLRGGGDSQIPQSEYLECLQSLQSQITLAQEAGRSPLDLREQIELFLLGLGRVENLRTPESATLKTILSLPIVPTKESFDQEPPFRQAAMQALHEAKPLISLSQVIYSEHAPYCWTQIPFPAPNVSLPTVALGKLKVRKSPRILTVWEHLRFLVQISEELRDKDVKAFLGDLSRTYKYLRDNAIVETKIPIGNLERVWLNIDYDTSSAGSDLPRARDIVGLWMDVSHLLLFSPYDPGEMQSVRHFLMPYEELLKLCGCKPILHPALRTTGANVATSETTLSGIASLWVAQQMTDITFLAEHKTIGAHKLVLVAVSGYWRARSIGGWSGQDNNSPINLDLDGIKYETLVTLLQFAYGDNINWASMELNVDSTLDDIADRLDILLDILTAADMWLMPRLHGLVESFILERARKFIRLDNVRMATKVAEKAHALQLVAYCKDYCGLNVEAMTIVDEEDSLQNADGAANGNAN